MQIISALPFRLRNIHLSLTMVEPKELLALRWSVNQHTQEQHERITDCQNFVRFHHAVMIRIMQI